MTVTEPLVPERQCIKTAHFIKPSEVEGLQEEQGEARLRLQWIWLQVNLTPCSKALGRLGFDVEDIVDDITTF